LDLNQIVSEHEPIVQAIMAGDAEAAETLAREHNAPEVERAASAMAREQANPAGEPPAKHKKAASRQSKAA
jgi:DNA-binding FadR family transcriptional regulator